MYEKCDMLPSAYNSLQLVLLKAQFLLLEGLKKPRLLSTHPSVTLPKLLRLHKPV